MKNIVISLCLALFLLIGGYFAYAYFFEGERVSEVSVKQKDKRVAQQEQRSEGRKIAQGLEVGKYVVWSEQQENEDGSSIVSLWRYLLPTGKPEKFFTISLAEEETVRFDKFSDESLSIFVYKDGKIKERGKLVHLNGKVLGPAEQYPGRISPDRLWVIWWNSDDGGLYLRDITQDKIKKLDQGDIYLSGWSEDSSLFYWLKKSTNSVNNLAVGWHDTDKNQIFYFDLAADINQVKVYPRFKKVIVSNTSSLQLVDLTSQRQVLLVNSQDRIVDFYLFDNNSFAYLSAEGYYLVRQGKKNVQGKINLDKIYDWPQDNIVIGKHKEGVVIFLRDQNKMRILSSLQKNTWTEFDFIGIFDIR